MAYASRPGAPAAGGTGDVWSDPFGIFPRRTSGTGHGKESTLSNDSREPVDTGRRRLWRLIGGLVLTAVALAAFAQFASAPEAAVLTQLVRVKFLPALAAAGLMILAAAALGDWVLSALRAAPEAPLERLLCIVPVGSCLLSLLVLILGSCGILHRWVYIVLLLLLAATWVAKRGRSLGALRTKGPSQGEAVCVGLAAVLLGMSFISAFLPPWEYDVQEYHLGAPAEYLRAGRVVFLRDNVYANFPSNAEMTYLLGMVLTGDTLTGAYAGRLVNVAYGLVIAALAALSCKTLFGDRWRWEAYLAVYACPVVLVAGMIAHVTMPLMLYIALATYALLRGLKADDAPARRRWFILCGAGLGAAMGAKYTGFLFALAPIACAALAWGRVSQADRAKRMACILIPAGVLVSPWMMRNLVNTGNPVYPLLDGAFQSSRWSAEKDARFAHAHSPKDRSVAGLAARAADFFTNVHKVYVSPAVLLLALAALALWRRPANGPAVALLAALGLAMLLLWYFLTHQIDRFFAPSIVVLGFLAAAGSSHLAATGPGRATLRTLVLFFTAFSLFQNLVLARNAGVFDGALMFDRGDEMASFMRDRTDFAEVWETFEHVRAELPESAKLLLVGEARTFYCPRPFWGSTVFDDAPLVEVLRQNSVSLSLDCMRAHGITHILFNWPETRRLAETYRFTLDGAQRPGYLDLTPEQWQRFLSLKQKHLKLIKAAGKEHASGERHVELYEVVYPEDL